MSKHPSDLLIDCFIDTVRLQANAREMFPLEDERDQPHGQGNIDEAASVTEPCAMDDCKAVAIETCSYCCNVFCERCLFSHPCVKMRLIRARSYGEG